MSSLYTDVAGFGLIYTYIGAAIGSLIALAFIGFGLYQLFSADHHPSSADGQVISVSCLEAMGAAAVSVKYMVNGNVYTRGFPCDPYSERLTAGQMVTIKYNPADPTDAVLDEGMAPNAMGLVLIAGGLLILFFSFLSVWLAKRYKIFAAAEGISGLFRLFR